MKEIFALLERIKKASLVENKMGYKNAAVFGGFSAFVVSSLEKIIEEAGEDLPAEVLTGVSRVSALMDHYSESRPQDRQEYLGELLPVLELISGLEPAMAGKNTDAGQLQTKRNTDAGQRQTGNREPKPQATGKGGPKPQATGKGEPKPQATGKGGPELQFLKQVGPKRLQLLHKLGITTVEELLYHFPRRYEDRSRLKRFAQMKDGDTETVMGTVIGCQEFKPRKGLTITKAAVYDGSSIGYAVWFNQAYIKKQVTQGTEIMITGKVARKFGYVQISVNDFETLDRDDPLHAGRIIPFYPATEGLPAKVLRSVMKFAVDKYGPAQEEFLPPELIRKYRFWQLPAALEKIHFPDKLTEVEPARRRLVFEELFLLQLGVSLQKVTRLSEPGIKHKPDGPLVQKFLKNLPFALTGAQAQVLGEIRRDMEDSKPMNRLLQGDVGCGKTVVAAAALVKTVENGCQGAIMAPTEILAEQHFQGLLELLEPLGLRVALLTGSLAKKEKKQTLEDIRQGHLDIIAGTHAIIQDEVEFHRLGLAVTDEQHRFGVRQRAKLQKKGANPDVLVMTATPIPRTLALTVYGDLDISVINELPPGRRPVKTSWLNGRMKGRVYKFIHDQVKAGRQVYYICPLVEESEKIEVKAAMELAETLQTKIFPDLTVGLVHGRLKQEAKDTVMRQFKKGVVNILVATTVVEVGVNVPNAAVIVVEDADRFGLAQLHQLRGRVGRSTYQSHCILVADPLTEEGKTRMKIMQATSDGFVIAEEDLKLRGPGEFFGTRQSGLPDLKIADLSKDVKILQAAREEAWNLVRQDPGLSRPENAGLKAKVMAKFQGTDNYIKIS